MNAAKRFTGFLLLQNMVLRDFVREGLAKQSLDRDEVERLSRLEAVNAAEVARWERDFSLASGQATERRTHDG
jgi:hypothetical protein